MRALLGLHITDGCMCSVLQRTYSDKWIIENCVNVLAKFFSINNQAFRKINAFFINFL